METQTTGLAATRKIIFPNGRSAQLITASRDASPVEILNSLDVQPPPAVLVISGGGRNMEAGKARRLAPFFSLGVARAAKNRAAIIIDGGTQAGVMVLTGQAVADQEYISPLLGVAPAGKVTFPGAEAAADSETAHHTPLDPNHSHFVLVEGDQWGDETTLMYNLADALHRGALGRPGNGRIKSKPLPAVTLLAGGGIDGIALREVQATVRRGWPLVVLEGSGQLADEIVRRYRNQRRQGRLRRGLGRFGIAFRRWLSPTLQGADAFLNEIVEEGQIILFSLKDKPADLEKLLAAQLAEKPVDSILPRAWQRFAVYSQNATRHQKIYRFLKSWPLILGVLATALVLLNQFLSNPPVTAPPLPPPFNQALIQPGDRWERLLHLLVVLTPILVTLLLAADRLFKAGNKWLLLRYYAEQIKKDIYSYRVLSALEQPQDTDLPDKAAELAARLGSISRRLMRTEANESALQSYHGPVPPARYTAADDDGLRPLSPEEYVRIRINSQVGFYSAGANRLEKQLRPRQWLILIFGALGSLLAALGGAFQFWVPLSVALVSALTAYLEYQQVEQTIIKYNQAMIRLVNLTDWWVALSTREKADPLNIVRLVESAEQAMQSEHLGWVQQMQSSQAEAEKPSAPAHPEEPAAPDIPAVHVQPEAGPEPEAIQ